MTEEEARNKWCPHAIFVFGNGQVSGNREDGNYIYSQGVCNCIASDCMMWRWSDPVSQHNEKGTFHSAHMADEYPDKYTICPPMGYCGLGGKP